MNNIAKFYHQATKAKYKEGMEKPMDFKNWPKEWRTTYFKEYPRLLKIPLPGPKSLNFSLGRSLINRKSGREFSGKPINFQELSQLLFYSAGITAKKENDWNKTRRPYPSGGARFPLELYPIILGGNSKLKEGIYHYNVKEHSLEMQKEKNLRGKIYPQIIWQEMALTAPMILVVSAVFERNMMKYKERGYRYILFEAGHLGQNIYLVSTALGLKCCAIGGFDDDSFNGLLDIDGKEETVFYAFVLGR